MTPDQITQLRQKIKAVQYNLHLAEHFDCKSDILLDEALALIPCSTCNGKGEIPDDFDDCGGVGGACVEIMHMNGELMKPCPDCKKHRVCVCCEEITEENTHLHRNCGK